MWEQTGLKRRHNCLTTGRNEEGGEMISAIFWAWKKGEKSARREKGVLGAEAHVLPRVAVCTRGEIRPGQSWETSHVWNHLLLQPLIATNTLTTIFHLQSHLPTWYICWETLFKVHIAGELHLGLHVPFIIYPLKTASTKLEPHKWKPNKLWDLLSTRTKLHSIKNLNIHRHEALPQIISDRFIVCRWIPIEVTGGTGERYWNELHVEEHIYNCYGYG